MKTISILLALGLSTAVHAGFETWTSSDGREATMNLLSVTEIGGEKVGTFTLRSGRKVTLRASELSSASAERLNNWTDPDAEASEAGPESVFDDILDGNLVRLDGRRLKDCDDATKPAKYYVFYYTASWCGPCQQFTPSLVKWYDENKNDNFELVLISSDSDEDAMEEYAEQKSMPWPQLELDEVEDFKEDFQHGVSGIPSVIVCELDGENLGNFRSNLAGLTDLVKE